jgi:CubicO group peptidase (beta-lactamase class C family)
MALIAGHASAGPEKRVEVLNGPVAAAVDRQLTAAAAEGFGGAVVIEMGGEMVLKAGYGYADREAGAAFTADTAAQIGSITKTFTALAVIQLAAAGRLDLKSAVKTYLPTAAEPAASATLSQLMTHTAGLADYCGGDFDRRTKTELLTICMAKPLAHPAGKYVYSNMGLSIAAAVVEAVAGHKWEDYLRDHIWRPFGMTRTGWTFDAPRSGGFAVGYLNDKPRGVISDRIAALAGADWNLKGNGGLQASAADMHRFYRGIMRQAEAVRGVMLQPHVKGEEPGVMEGYGLFFRLDGSGKPYRIGHGGSDGVFFSYFAIFPQHNTFLYFVGNNGEQPVKDQLKAALKAVQTAVGIADAVPPKHGGATGQ